MDTIKIQKNGNGNSIMIPAHLMRALCLSKGDLLGCEVVDGKLSYDVLRRFAPEVSIPANHRRSAAANHEAKS